MRKDVMHQEILLYTCNTYIQKEFFKKQLRKKSKEELNISHQLEKACWNGQLQFILPEILEKTEKGKPLFLWHIRNEINFLQIELSEFPLTIDKIHSIDTKFFLTAMIKN